MMPSHVPHVRTWNDVHRLARRASKVIPLPDAEAQRHGASPVGDALGVSDALIETGLPPVTAAVQALPSAFVQAAGGPPASTSLGSLLGVGLGGATTGTGPLPGALGVAAQQLFGQSGVPTPGRFPAVRVILELHPSFRRVLEGTGTSLVSRLFGIKPRLLGDFRSAFLNLAALSAEDEFRAGVLTLLRELVNHVSGGLGGTPFAPPPLVATPVATTAPSVPVVTPPAPAVIAPTTPGAPALQSIPALLQQALSKTPFGGTPAPVVTPAPPISPALFQALTLGLQPTQGATVTGSTAPGSAPIAAQVYRRATTITGSTAPGSAPIAAIPFTRSTVTPVTVTPVGTQTAKPVFVTPIGQDNTPHFVTASAPQTPQVPQAPQPIATAGSAPSGWGTDGIEGPRRRGRWRA